MQAVGSVSERLLEAQVETGGPGRNQPGCAGASWSGQGPAWERVLHSHTGAEGGSPLWCRVSDAMSFWFQAVGSEGLQVTLSLPALIATF